MCSIIYKGTIMSEKTILTHNDIMDLAGIVAGKIRMNNKDHVRAYAIPRGGIPALYAVIAAVNFTHLDIRIALTPEEADIFIDDIIDSGATMQRYCDLYPGKPFYALIDKTDPVQKEAYNWVVFPWEGESETSGIEDNIRRLLQHVGEDASRGGLLETPRRVAKAWNHWTSGYSKDPAQILKVFEDGADGCDEMVIVRDIPIYSKCEHHLADIFGTATVAYIPNGKIVGLSKISRLVDMFARRLQVQERLTNQIANALDEHLQPLGVGVIIRARHLCMESRGICQQGHHTITSALRGALKTNESARSEFMLLSK
jgi:GTP cyclohydrolase I